MNRSEEIKTTDERQPKSFTNHSSFLHGFFFCPSLWPRTKNIWTESVSLHWHTSVLTNWSMIISWQPRFFRRFHLSSQSRVAVAMFVREFCRAVLSLLEYWSIIVLLYSTDKCSFWQMPNPINLSFFYYSRSMFACCRGCWPFYGIPDMDSLHNLKRRDKSALSNSIKTARDWHFSFAIVLLSYYTDMINWKNYAMAILLLTWTTLYWGGPCKICTNNCL